MLKSTGKMVQKLWLRDTGKSMLIYAYDLDFDPMALIFELDQDIITIFFFTSFSWGNRAGPPGSPGSATGM